MGMLRTATLIALGIAAAGCKSQAVREAESLADQMCACRSIRCAADVTRKAAEVLVKHKDDTGGNSDRAAIEAAAARMRTCAQSITHE